jgi:hypothetical protein
VTVRVRVHVRPGSSRTVVGGDHDGALVVRVPARAVGGGATQAALTALAEALGLRRRQVRLVSGATSREKLVEVDLPAGSNLSDDEVTERLERLRSVP